MFTFGDDICVSGSLLFSAYGTIHCDGGKICSSSDALEMAPDCLLLLEEVGVPHGNSLTLWGKKAPDLQHVKYC